MEMDRCEIEKKTQHHSYTKNALRFSGVGVHGVSVEFLCASFWWCYIRTAGFGECLLKIKEAHIVSGPLDGVTGELITSSSFVADSLVSQVQHNTSLEQPRQDRRLAVSRAEVRLILQVSSAAALQHDSLIGF